MFDFIRNHQRLMQLVLLVLILPSFVLIGVSGYSTYTSGDRDLVEVGKGAITLQEYDMARRQQLEQIQRNSGGAFDPAVLDNTEARRALLDALIDQRIQVDIAQKDRFSVSDAALRQSIAVMPQWQQDGQFSSDTYHAVLASAGLTPKDFEQSQRAQLALDRVLGPVRESAATPADIQGRLAAALARERTVRLRTFDVQDYLDDVSVSDADIQAWYDANAQRLTRPEHVDIDYILLDEAAASQGVATPSPDELKAYYEQNRARYVQPARVQVRHIQVNLPSDAAGQQAAREKAADIAARAKADPANFVALAQEVSQDPGTARDGGMLGWVSPGIWPADLENILFSLEPGQVSEAVDGPGGLHVFYIEDKQAEQGETFEQAQDKVLAEVRHQLAAERFADMATRLTALIYDQPDDLRPAADALNLPVLQARGIGREHLLSAAEVGAPAAADGDHAALLNDARVRVTAYSPSVYTERQNSGVIELSSDTLMVLRVADIVPAQVPPLDDVRDIITAELRAEKARDAARAAGEAALAQAKSEGEAALEHFDAPVTVSRVDPNGLSSTVINALFGVEPDQLPAYTGSDGQQGYVLAYVESESAGDEVDALAQALGGQITLAQGLSETDALLRALRVQAGVRLLPDADRAISGELDEQPS